MLRYLAEVVTLKLNEEACVGCGMCVNVCPHSVLAMDEKKASIVQRDACMECGACAKDCPTDALTVDAGVGCAAAIIKGALSGTEPCCDSDSGCCG